MARLDAGAPTGLTAQDNLRRGLKILSHLWQAVRKSMITNFDTYIRNFIHELFMSITEMPYTTIRTTDRN